MENNKILMLATVFRGLKAQKDDLQNQLKELQKQLDEAEKTLSDQMINNELQKFTFDGYTYYVNVRTMANALPEFKKDVYDWLKDNGYGDLVYETVNANSFSAFVSKDLLIETDELPKELQGKVNVYEKISVGMRKSR